MISFSVMKWSNILESQQIRQLMIDNHLYEETYENSLFKKFSATDPTVYLNGTAYLMYENNQIIGLSLIEELPDEKIDVCTRKKTMMYGYSGKPETTFQKRFRIMAKIGIYIKPEFRGNGHASSLLRHVEESFLLYKSQMLNDFNERDIPVFVMVGRGFNLAWNVFNFSRVISNAQDCWQRKQAFHEYAVQEKPTFKYDEYNNHPKIKSWIELLNKPEFNMNY